MTGARIPLRLKLFAVVAVVVVLLGVLVLSMRSAMDRALLREHEGRAAALANSFATMAVEPLLTDSTVSLASLMSDAKASDADVVYAFVRDPRGRVVAHSFAGPVPPDLLAVVGNGPGVRGVTATFETEKGPVSDYAAPLLGGTIGTLHLGVSRARVAERIRENQARLVAVTAAFLVVGLALSHLTGTYLTRPLTELVGAAEAIGRGDMDRRCRVTTRDEIGVLSAAFDRMSDDLRARDRAMREAQASLLKARDEMETRVTERTAQLAAANQELESFSYSVSHDLRAPLRGIEGFSAALMEEYGGALDETARGYLGRIRGGCLRMRKLIDDLLRLSRLSRVEMRREPVDLGELALSVVEELRRAAPDRTVEVVVAPGVRVHADPTLLRAAMANLLQNAWKFTALRDDARIELGSVSRDGKAVCFVRDNGAGFDMRYADKLFGAFQRLHSSAEFEGSGIGLATVQRIVHRHGGRVWAEGEVGKGATFYFTLGEESA